ncbi:unnamed protein product [Caenorhabditis angaria]|uniref:Uncharacterized protein n=1 Tax=Caenorhabditis angaria TaxID=860376 RepID=A0A9P1MUU3_9PELO|nr:unnamed protein product [Caenorhabditis angaria]
MTEVNKFHMNKLFGANDALSLLLCRGAAQCNVDTSKPEVIAEFEKKYICENHINELLTGWYRNVYGHIAMRKQGKGSETRFNFYQRNGGNVERIYEANDCEFRGKLEEM